MYVKEYIFRMEMSQRIHFWHQNLLKITNFLKNSKKTPFWSKKIQTAYKMQFSVRNAKIA